MPEDSPIRRIVRNQVRSGATREYQFASSGKNPSATRTEGADIVVLVSPLDVASLDVDRFQRRLRP
jgi:hypothetical protein